jgi:DNA-directed RNA polymerase subunit RPC12/RpoP
MPDKLPPPPLREDGAEWVDCPVCDACGTRTFESSFAKQEYQIACQQCFGRGYVVNGSLDHKCTHDYHYSRTVGRCLTEYKCRRCGTTYEIDSSD